MIADNSEKDKKHPTIKSYGSRQGRVTDRQKAAMQKAGDLLLSVDNSWDFKDIFPSSAATILEIGFGNGESFVQMAKNNPDCNFIGIEVYTSGVAQTVAKVIEDNISNVRICQHDAVEVLESCVLDNSLDKVQIFFPDPWPKKRHHKRRIINTKFIDLIGLKLKPQGLVHLATDWHPYAEVMLDILQNSKLTNKSDSGGFCDYAESLRCKTKFEARGKRMGHQIYDLLYVKDSC